MTIDPNNGPLPGDPGDLSHLDGNQLATQASHPHDNDVNMAGEDTDKETGLETADFNTYGDKLTATSNTDTDNTLKELLRNTFLPEDQIKAILAAS